MTRWALGADLGGTNLRVAAVTTDGAVLAHASAPVDWAADPARPFGQLLDTIDQVAAAVPAGGAGTPPVGVGLGATGPVDSASGTIANPWTLPPAMQGDVARPLARYGAVVVENDADVAAVAEHRFGAGRGRCMTVCLTVGTGIGVGVVTDRGLHRGAAGFHPEAGHQVVDPSGPLCYCGAHGCVESLASARAVVDAAVRDGIVPGDASAVDVHRLAVGGDPRATAITDRARAALRAAARNVVAVHAPDVLVFAGQAVGDTARLVAETEEELSRFPFRPGPVTVAFTGLDDLGGCLGAASLVLFR